MDVARIFIFVSYLLEELVDSMQYCLFGAYVIFLYVSPQTKELPIFNIPSQRNFGSFRKGAWRYMPLRLLATISALISRFLGKIRAR